MQVVDTQVWDGGPAGALLDVRLVLQLAAVSPDQRRDLVALVRGGRPLTLTALPTG